MSECSAIIERMIDARDGVRTEWVLPDLDAPDGPDGYRSIADIVSNFTMVEALKAQLEASLRAWLDSPERP